MIETCQASNGRWYREDGGPWLPSVTSITGLYPKGEGFDRWLGGADSYRDAIEQRDRAAASGERIHQACADLVQNHHVDIPDDWTDDEVAKLLGFKQFCQDFSFIPESVEKQLLYPGLFGGRLDFTGTVADKIGKRSDVIVDVKTGNNVYASHMVQLVAYAAAENHAGSFNPQLVIALQLKSTTKKGYQCHVLTLDKPTWEDTDEWMVFAALWTVHRHFYGAEPKISQSKEREKEVSL